ncbi:DUF2480 family protein [Aquimarina sp. ERC-38]|uniref:DUF2480 family protein n=1 Tax=Aquimarina sp. ERC-38 TaxID=2949996 RepID=UPI002245A398|nr:DUF2480 family protein [Aquimarina sp. ERC-38]UZO81807.1 DUF2480 family protein [Aquimarina sp. ERC-38]
METIRNKVAENTNLVTIDLEDYYPNQKRVVVDIKDWLFQELVVREKEFRDYVNNHNWEQYLDCYVVFTCSVEAIIPGWVYPLLMSKVAPFALKAIHGSYQLLDILLYQEVINNLDITIYKDKFVIIKGCVNKPVPDNAYLFLIEKLQPVVKSIMYGEACSSVPIYKKLKG